MTPEPSEQPEVVAVAMQHARRGVLLQVVLRWVLVGFVALTVLTVPPTATSASAPQSPRATRCGRSRWRC